MSSSVCTRQCKQCDLATTPNLSNAAYCTAVYRALQHTCSEHACTLIEQQLAGLWWISCDFATMGDVEG
eukprot:14425-Heterococcus_DN1.PRE.2